MDELEGSDIRVRMMWIFDQRTNWKSRKEDSLKGYKRASGKEACFVIANVSFRCANALHHLFETAVFFVEAYWRNLHLKHVVCCHNSDQSPLRRMKSRKEISNTRNRNVTYQWT